MSSLGSMVEEVLLGLEGYSGDQAVIGTLSAGVTDSASTLTLFGGPFADGLGFSTGLVEVGEELCYAQAFNRTTGEYSGVLRGWRGSAPSAHVAGEIVRTNPTYPRVSVRKAINDTLANVDLWAVREVEIIATTATSYTLPAGVEQILSVTCEPWFAQDAWEYLNHWSLERDSGSGRTLRIRPFPGRKLRVSYTARPSELTALSDDFATVSGLPGWCRDVIVYGAMWRLVSMVDQSRLTGLGVDQAIQAQTHPSGSGQSQAKYLLGMFKSRLDEAMHRQQLEWPAQRRWVL